MCRQGFAVFQNSPPSPKQARACLCTFDLLELNGTDPRRDPIERRKATLTEHLSRKSGATKGVRLNYHLDTRSRQSIRRGMAPDEMLGLALRRLAEALPHRVPCLSECSQIPSMCRERLPPAPCFGPQEDDPMSRYHFAVKDAARYEDPDGMELPDDAAVRDYAIRVIREVQHGEDHNWTGWTMEVRQGQRIVWQIPFETVEPKNDG